MDSNETLQAKCPARPAALAKQGSPPADLISREAAARLVDERARLIRSLAGFPHQHAIAAGEEVLAKEIRALPSLSPPADTVERAREIVIECFDDVHRFPNAKAICDRLIDRISAALVEKEHEVWDKAAEIAERHNEGHNYDYRNCGLAIATAIRARTSEKSK